METYLRVCADVHLQSIVLAEGFVTVRALVRTLSYRTTKENVNKCPARDDDLTNVEFSFTFEVLLQKVNKSRMKIWVRRRLHVDYL